MARFDRSIALAHRLIKKNGELVQWRQILDARPIDPDKPWLGSKPRQEEHDVWICFVPVENKDERKLFQYMTGTEIQLGRLAGLMGTVGFKPTAEDFVIREGEQLRILTLDLLKPNSQSILYTIEFSG